MTVAHLSAFLQQKNRTQYLCSLDMAKKRLKVSTRGVLTLECLGEAFIGGFTISVKWLLNFTEIFFSEYFAIGIAVYTHYLCSGAEALHHETSSLRQEKVENKENTMCEGHIKGERGRAWIKVTI